MLPDVPAVIKDSLLEIPFTSTAGSSAGDVVNMNGMLGLVGSDVSAGLSVTVSILGDGDFAKEAALAISQGEKVYFDETNKVINKTDTNPYAGRSYADAAAADTRCRVLYGFGNN